MLSVIDSICRVILFAFGVLTFHKYIYTAIGFFFKAKKYPVASKQHKYGVVIAARNEEAVIGNLIKSLKAQDYPAELLKIYVVADNCTDSTAEICRSLGVTVFERHDTAHARKGYAMEYLFGRLAETDGIESVEGYFVFDADNLVAPDFVTRMNEAFDAGNRIVTSYRNSKNFETNWVSSAYAIHFYNNSLGDHRPRSLLGFGTHLTGTGYLIDSSLLANGWHFTTFTEDDQITMAMTGKGIKVAYCEQAEFFDEQPVSFGIAMRQRVRWAKGRLTNFFKYGHNVFFGIFRRGSFTCYDMFTHYFPYGLFNWLLKLVYPIATFIIAACVSGHVDVSGTLKTFLYALAIQYAGMFVAGALTVIRERRHIHCSTPRIIAYLFAYPWFSMISIFVYIIAIFKHVTWKPIPHKDSREIGEIGERQS